MEYLRKPYKTFQTNDEKKFSIGDEVSFLSVSGEKVQGFLIGATVKGIEIIKDEESLKSEKWLIENITEGTLKQVQA